MREIWPEFDQFSHVKWSLDPTGYATFRRLLTGIRVPQHPAPQAHDVEAPPVGRVQTTVLRVVRDTQLSNRIKVLHNHECQICGHTILLADGSRYAEGHHVQPLGGHHNGPDLPENIVCLCPNHHAAYDLGATQLTLDELRSVDGHTVGRQYIDYHNKTIYSGNVAHNHPLS
jgi:hypothetical protein